MSTIPESAGQVVQPEQTPDPRLTRIINTLQELQARRRHTPEL